MLSNPPLTVGVCYVPPQGSAQLADAEAARARFAAVTDHLATAGPVILGDDFNARVGTLLDPWAALLGEGIPAHRQQADPHVNGHGRLLIQACEDSAMVLCTSRAPSDIPAPASFTSYAQAGTSRVDHFLVSGSLFSDIQSCTVAPARPDSDHAPLVMSINIDCGTPDTWPNPASRLRTWRWESTKQAAYADETRLPTECHAVRALH